MRIKDREKKEFLTVLEKTVGEYSFDQYVKYPTGDPEFWKKNMVKAVSAFVNNKENQIHFEINDDLLCFVGCRLSRWDYEHYGFGMAMINWLVHPNHNLNRDHIKRLIDETLAYLRNNNIKYVSAHISGEDLISLHLLEEKGFCYYQTTVYPVAKVAEFPCKVDSRVRMMRETDLESVVRVAKNNQFRYGHYYCDCRFDKSAVDGMYEKWIHTSWKNKEPIAVLEYEGKIAGYFAFKMDDNLSTGTRHGYGVMRSLAMDSNIRGKGLGMILFRSVMSYIAKLGGEYIASEYPSKNYASAYLHIRNHFYPVHEKILMHLWLK